MSETNLIEIQVDRIITTTLRAILVDDGDQEVWLPASQIDMESIEHNRDGTVTLMIPEWLASEKGLI